MRENLRNKILVIGWLLAYLCTPALTLADAISHDEPAVTPYRPTVSTPATLSAPGWVEIEAGWIGGGTGPDKRQSLPYSLKLAVSPDWGIRIDGEAAVGVPAANRQTQFGFGDTSFVLKRRFEINDRSAFGMEAGIGTSTGKEPFQSGSGRTDYTLNGIYSTDLGEAYHVDLNYAVTRLGAVSPTEGRDQSRWVAAVSRSLIGSWGLAGELSGTAQAGAAPTRQLLLAASYTPSRIVCWDAGFARGLTAASPRWSIFVGFTVLTAKLF